MDDPIKEVWRDMFGAKKPAEVTPFDGQEFIDPREFREWLQKPCAKCGLPTVQQYSQVSHRGNFRHGGRKIVVRPIGKVCECGGELCAECQKPIARIANESAGNPYYHIETPACPHEARP